MKETELDRLFSWLARKHYPFKREWLRICVQYIEGSLGQRIKTVDVKQIGELVIQQFLNSKISEALDPTMKIPTSAVKVVIVKRMIFQVISLKICRKSTGIFLGYFLHEYINILVRAIVRMYSTQRRFGLVSWRIQS